jgi:hypothetical protein
LAAASVRCCASPRRRSSTPTRAGVVDQDVHQPEWDSTRAKALDSTAAAARRAQHALPVGTGLDQHRLSRLFTALINAVVEQAFARSSRTGRPIDPPLLLCLDEAANVAPLPTSARSRRSRPAGACRLSRSFRTWPDQRALGP